ncbi:deoxynucleoside kinase [Inquilinus limosus]|uniref:hypothetical protein n=1 Tax=Inquilinus limosus TaxID=171674 RepID=UPI003F16A66D
MTSYMPRATSLQFRDGAEQVHFPYLAFEGCDGVGKSTIRQRVAAYLAESGFPVVEIGQHSWLDIAAARVIIDARENRRRLPPDEVCRAYILDKQLHSSENILRNHNKALIVADRSIVSDAVYQEALYSISADDSIGRYVSENLVFPDIIIYVSVDIAVAIKRIETRSKHRRHYERECDLRIISDIYDRILRNHEEVIAQQIIRFVNDRDDLDGALRSTLYPQLDAALARIVPGLSELPIR